MNYRPNADAYSPSKACKLLARNMHVSSMGVLCTDAKSMQPSVNMCCRGDKATSSIDTNVDHNYSRLVSQAP